METLSLSKPITTLAGEKVSELHFNFENLRAIDYRNISRLESRLRGVAIESDVSLTKTASSEFRMATAWIAAVNHADNKVCLDDIDALSFQDLLELEKIGLFFIAGVE